MSPVVSEFSRPWEADRLNTPVRLEASASECAAIARRLGLMGVEKLEGEIRLEAGAGRLTLAKGFLRAKVTQTCVVTLEPVPAEISVDIEDEFGDNITDITSYEGEDAPDLPDPILNGKIDLGELLVQHLSLALDPYPRKPGVEFDGYEAG